MKTVVRGKAFERARGGLVIRAVAVLICSLFMGTVHAVERQTLHNQLPAAVRQLQSLNRLSASRSMDLTISLPLRNREVLTNLLQQIYDPASTNYHRYLTPEQFARQFGPTEKDYQRLLTYLKSQGFTVTGTHPNRTLVDVNGTAGNIEKVFQIGLRTYQHPTEGRTFYAPDTEPSFDQTLPILSVSGLDNYILPRPMNLKTKDFHQSTNVMPHVTGSGPRGNFIGKDFRAAYVPGVTLNGAGQAVGLFELDGYFQGDIAEYEALTGLPNVPITNVRLNNVGGFAGANNVEVALDIEMVISMAPGLSQVIIYEGINPNSVLNRMATDNLASQLSSSWGFGSQVDAARDQIFQQFAAQGQSMFQASGDLGAWPGAIFPPSDNPFLTVVGGTSLTTTNPNGAWFSETAWSLSGGGISTSYPLPVWQQGAGIPVNQGSTTMRNIPDVACLADSVIWIVANNGEQGVVGGTSASAPLWAGFMALVNQQAAASGKASMGFINPAIYAMGKRPDYAINFHDVVSGNNTNSGSPDKFFAVTGYDLCTGWGTPNGSNLISALLGPPDSLLITPETIVTAIGAVNGPFNPAAQNYSLTTVEEVPVNWIAANSSPWLNVSPMAGTIASNSPGTVTFSLNSAASNLLAGSHVATVWFTNLNNGFAQSRQFILDVITPPVITTQPSNLTVLAGAAARFAVGTVTNAQLFYQWQRNGTNINNGGNVFGADTSILTIAGASPADSGTYAVVVSNALGSVKSVEATLSVLPVITPEATMATLYSFTGGNDGANPNALMQSTNGDFYGTTQHGGPDGAGTVFRMTSDGIPTNLHSFSGQADGAHPQAALVQAMDGNLYGTTFEGGATDNGTIFKITTNGLLTTLVSFNITNGDFPYAGLTLATDGNLYGTTYQGGSDSHGTAFKMNTNGILSTLASFDDDNGSFVHAGLIQGMDGNFYGATFSGGFFDGGTVFKMTTNGTLTTLISLNNNAGGAFPYATLLQDEDGNFYGTVAGGALYNNGAVFKISPAGVFTNLHSFTGDSDGAHPFAGLIQGADGNFYGTTPYGGDYGYGTVFRISTDGTLTHLVKFNGENGANPITALTQGMDGDLYGTTQNGGAMDHGVIFRLHLDGPLQFTMQPASQTVYSGTNIVLSVATSGGVPLSYQWQMNGTNLLDGGNLSGSDRRILIITNVVSANAGVYSVIVSNSFGAVSSDAATVQVMVTPPLFTMQPTNQTVAPGAIVTFNANAIGSLPLSYHWQKDGTNLVDGARISGTASRNLTLSSVVETNNGIYSVVVSNEFGTITSSGATLSVVPVSAAGTRLAVLHSFNVSAGGWQPNGLMRASDGNLYGTTESGGTNRLGGAGTVFKMTTNGEFTTLITFTGVDGGAASGANPVATLVQDTNGNFYGATQFGGTNGAGNVFKLAPDYTPSNLYSFTGEGDDYAPTLPLLVAADGNLYGSSSDYSGASIFRLTLDGQYTHLHTFTGIDGDIPAGALLQATDGNFYGMAVSGGAYGQGTIFKMTQDGVLTNIYSFSGGPDGASPAGSLVQGTDGNLYGVTQRSTTNLVGMTFQLGGTVFRITTNGALTLLYSGPAFSSGFHSAAGLILGSDGNFYGITSGEELGSQAGSSPGNGTVFRFAPDGMFTTLVAFDKIDGGAHPSSALVEGPDGAFYGTTTIGGTGGRGTIFKLSITSPPQITSQPASTVVALGGNVMFSVAVAGAPQLFYQWQKNGTNLNDGPNISGSATRILFLNNVSLADAGNYSVNVSNALGSVTSTDALLTIIAQPVFQDIRMTNGIVTLNWSAMAGQRYQMQFNADIASTNWVNLGSIISATNDTVTATDAIDSSARRFYRVVLLH